MSHRRNKIAKLLSRNLISCVGNNIATIRANSGDPLPARLDAIDRQILTELQDDGRITNVELASRVGISAPPCLRRVRALEEAGYIKGYRALLDERLLGYEVAVFAMVHLSSQAEADLKAFEEFVRKEPLVRECWMLSGEIDFMLKCVAPDLEDVSGLRHGTHRRAARTQRQDLAYAAQLQGRGDGADGSSATAGITIARAANSHRVQCFLHRHVAETHP